MLEITIPGQELWDEEKEEFVTTKAATIRLEHSLISLSKWESKWHKPFLKKDKKTVEETTDYIRCMTLTQNVDPDVYEHITQDILDKVVAYIEDTMTATWFSSDDKPGNEIITAEIIYYQMIALNIPFECQKWHLNRLLTLIKVCVLKNTPEKKLSPKELAKRNSAINAARRKAMKSKG